MSACAQNYHIHELEINDGVILRFDRDNCQFFPNGEFEAVIINANPADAMGGLIPIHPKIKSLTKVYKFDLTRIVYSVSACIKGAFEIQKFEHPFEYPTILQSGGNSNISGLIFCNKPLFIREKLNVMFEEKGLGNVFGDREGIQFIS